MLKLSRSSPLTNIGLFSPVFFMYMRINSKNSIPAAHFGQYLFCRFNRGLYIFPAVRRTDVPQAPANNPDVVVVHSSDKPAELCLIKTQGFPVTGHLAKFGERNGKHRARPLNEQVMPRFFSCFF